MKISKRIKEDIAIKAATAMIAKKRDAVYETLRKEFTGIAERQFASLPVKTLMKYGEFIRFSSYLDGGDDYPKGFKDTERTRLYKELGFVHPCEIPLYKSFPCKLFSYEAEVCGEYANEYTTAVRKYMLLYFKAAGNYELILESLKTISTDKQLRDNFPELLIFYTIPEDKGRELVPIETLNRCKALLRESRQLILENL